MPLSACVLLLKAADVKRCEAIQRKQRFYMNTYNRARFRSLAQVKSEMLKFALCSLRNHHVVALRSGRCRVAMRGD